MISVKANLTLVGVFVLMAGVTLIVALALLAGRAGPVDEYYMEFSNVAGLKYGSQVVYEGYPIGQVESIEPLHEGERLRFRVTFSVISGWNIPEDSVARSEASGLLAPQSVAISAGRSKILLEPGSLVRSGEDGGLFSSISSVAGNVSQLTDQALLPLIHNLDRKVDLFGEVLEQDIRPLLRNTDQVMASVGGRLPSILSNADRAVADLSSASQQVAGIISPERLARIDQMLADADAALTSLRHSSQELERLVQANGPELTAGVKEFRATMQSLSRHSEPFGQNLNLTSRNLQDFSRQLRQNPGLFLRGTGQPDDTVPPLRPVDEQ